MAVTPGTRIGPYEVIARIGAGGMGEVYRARDTKLHRDVALKVLPDTFATDPDRLARFRREAQLLAALNHPHIAQIYGFEDSGRTHALVMELVEGPTLADAIDNEHALRVDDALHVARQIADALEAAHGQGIVHRDLKPANIKLQFEDATAADLATCRVKVLDFGLAKAMDAPGAAENPSDSPTMTSPVLTGMGTILGTATYMSPEQARGRAVDRRADVWAFGVVFYEMLTGRAPFAGDDVSDTLANVLKRDPDWSALPAEVPPVIRQVLRACLQKRVKDRLADVQDVRLALDGAFDTPAPAVPAPIVSGRRRFGFVAGAAMGVVAAAAMAGALWWWHNRTASTSGSVMRLSILPPPDRPLAIPGRPTRSLAISPDGTSIVYLASVPDSADEGVQPSQLEIRSLASRTVHDLAGTQGARQPFFSPDGRWVGFLTTSGEIKKVSLTGGSPITLATHINGSGWSFGVWLPDDTIVVGDPSGLQRVSAQGGALSTIVARAPTDTGVELFNSVARTANGRALLFTLQIGHAAYGGTYRIDALRLDSNTRTRVLDNAAHPLVTPDGRHLLFERDGTLLVAPFDEAALAVTGPAVPILDEIGSDASGINTTPEWALSETGTLAYVAATDETEAIGLVARDGVFQPLAVPRGVYSVPRVSPDGRTIAFTAVTPRQTEIRLFDLARGSVTKLPADGPQSMLAWAPDGQSVAVTAEASGTTEIASTDLTGRSRTLVSGGSGGGDFLRNASLSPDGTELAYTSQVGSQLDIWKLTMAHPPAVPYLDSAAAEHSPQFSPDGHWLAYVSDESGRPQVYVRRYPQGPRVMASITGGQGPTWRRDGRELFFEGTANELPKLMAVAITPAGDATLRLGAPVPLFDLRSPDANGAVEAYAASTNGGVQYDVMPDGRHFVMLRHAESPLEIVVVPHWLDGLTSTR
jgi:Tol biopolymer transport system component